MENRPWQRHYDYNVPFTIRYPRIAAHHLLNIPVGSFPDKPATNFYGTEISFWDLKQQILHMANALGAMGVKKGDRIGVHLPNCPQYIIAYYAALTLGAVVVNLNPMYTVDELNALTAETGVSTLFTFDMVLPHIRLLCREVEFARIIVTRVTDYIEGFGLSTPEELELEEAWYHFSRVLENASSTRLPRIDIVPEDPALIQFTGGTTGLPKGAVLTHGNLVAATMQCSLWGSAFTDLTPHEKRSVMAVLPFFHVYGTIVVLNWGMFNSATQILVPRFDIDEFMGLLANFERITFFPAVPTMINAVINQDMIIAGGYNIFPREIDEVLYQHPKIADAVSIGIADEYRGETVKAFVVVKAGENLTEEDVIGFCREKLAAYKSPKIIEFREDLPKSAVGKILRKVLREEEPSKNKS